LDLFRKQVFSYTRLSKYAEINVHLIQSGFSLGAEVGRHEGDGRRSRPDQLVLLAKVFLQIHDPSLLSLSCWHIKAGTYTHPPIHTHTHKLKIVRRGNFDINLPMLLNNDITDDECAQSKLRTQENKDSMIC
jgi:hypothetical protein